MSSSEVKTAHIVTATSSVERGSYNQRRLGPRSMLAFSLLEGVFKSDFQGRGVQSLR
jgi:hypothetical protein